MQTFLPYPSFSMSAHALDNQRLNKQITECYQLLNALLAGGGWNHHPAAKMWAGHEGALVAYAFFCYEEFVARGGAASHKSWAKIEEQYGHLLGTDPTWIGDEDFHSSHRARLLHKGNIDVARKRIKIYLNDICSDLTIDQWVQNQISPFKRTFLRDLTVRQLARITEFLDSQGIPSTNNWYEQFGWSEEPSDEYFWPVATAA